MKFLFRLAIAILPFVFANTCKISYGFQTIGMPKADRHDRTGSFMGYDYFLWDCVGGKRTVVYRWEREMPFLDFDPYHKEEVLCGEKTEFERENGIGK